ncbi:hypothetical protein [Gemella morbillorum]
MFTIILYNCNIIANAEILREEKVIEVTNIDYEIIVPENFNKIVEINLTNEDGTRMSITLDKEHNYKNESTIHIGQNKINYVKVLGDTNDNYEYNYNQTVTAYSGQKAELKVDIKGSNNNVESGESAEQKQQGFVGNHQYEVDEESKENENKENIDIPPTEETENENRETITDKIEKFFRKYVITLGIVGICGVIAIIIKLKGRM